MSPEANGGTFFLKDASTRQAKVTLFFEDLDPITSSITIDMATMEAYTKEVEAIEKMISDETKIGQRKWSVAKRELMQPDYKKTDTFTDLNEDDQRLVEVLRKKQSDQGDLDRLDPEEVVINMHSTEQLDNASLLYFIPRGDVQFARNGDDAYVYRKRMSYATDESEHQVSGYIEQKMLFYKVSEVIDYEMDFKAPNKSMEPDIQ